MVRSSTVPSSSTATPSLRTHPSAWWTAPDDVGPQHDLVEGLARRHRHRAPSRRRRPWRWPRRPSGDRTVTGTARPRRAPAPRPSRAARRTAASAQPAPRRSADTGGPGTATSSTTRPGATDATALTHRSRPAEPGVRATRSTPDPVGAHTGRDRGALRPVAHHVLAGEHDPHRPARARRPGDGPPPATGEATFPPKAPPLASGRDRLAAGHAPRRVGLEVGGLDERRLQGEVPVARAGPPAGGAAPRSELRPGTLLGRAPGPRRATRPPTQPPAAVGHRHQRVGRGGVVGEAPAAAAPRRRPTVWGTPPSSAARRAAAAEVAWPPRRPAAAARDSSEPVDAARPPRRSSATPCTDTGGRAGRARTASSSGTPRAAPEGGQPHDDPRRAEAALAGPGVGEGSAQPVAHHGVEAVEGGDRRDRPPVEPA